MTLLHEVPFGLSRRLAMSSDEAWERSQAALVARIERAYCRAHGIDGWSRNARARCAARQFVKAQKFQRTGVA